MSNIDGDRPQYSAAVTTSNIAKAEAGQHENGGEQNAKAPFGTVMNWWFRTSTAAYLAMWGLLLLGLASAMAHHLFYSYLNSRPIGDAVPQDWANRIGTALAYLFKTALVAAISVAYWQVFWYIVRRKAIEIGSLDNFAAVLTNPFMFFCRDFLKKGTLLFGLAVAAWLLPISSVFAPGTLTVTTARRPSISNISVPVLASPNNTFGFLADPAFDYYFQDLAYRVAVEAEIIAWPSPCGYNCSYSFSFLGPAYQCANLGPFSSLSINLTDLFDSGAGVSGDGGLMPPFWNESILFFAFSDGGNDTRPVGLWIIYDSLNETLRCDLYNATYIANVSYEDTVQTVDTQVEYHNLILNGAALARDIMSAPNVSETFTDLDLWAPLNLYFMEALFSSMLTGYVAVVQSNVSVATVAAFWTGVAQWNTTTGEDFVLTFNDLAINVPAFLANATLSLISLGNPYKLMSLPVSSTLIVEAIVAATATSYPTVYSYAVATLWQLYASALGAATICLILGSVMLYTNGVVGQLTFSQVLVTTRNPTLDEISEGAGLGGEYITDRVRRAKVKYGKLSPTEVGFGMDDQVQSLEAS